MTLPPPLEGAACAGLPPLEADAFFFTAAGRTLGKRVCRGCPVRLPCLERVLEAEHAEELRYGVYAGLTAPERSAIARGRREAAS